MKRLLQRFKPWGRTRKIIVVMVVLLLSWRGYSAYQLEQKISKVRQLGFYVGKSKSYKDVGVDTKAFGFIGIRGAIPTSSIVVTSFPPIRLFAHHLKTNPKAKRLESIQVTDELLPELIQALEEFDRPISLQLHANKLTTLTGFEKLTQLESLDIGVENGQLIDISALKDQPILEVVQIRRATNLKKIDSLGSLPRLEVILLDSCGVSAKEITKFRKKTGYTGQLFPL